MGKCDRLWIGRDSAPAISRPAVSTAWAEYALPCEDVETGRAVLELLKNKRPASEGVAHYEEVPAGEE